MYGENQVEGKLPCWYRRETAMDGKFRATRPDIGATYGRWFLFDADTGQYFGDKGSKLGCVRSACDAWSVSRASVSSLPIGQGGVMLTPNPAYRALPEGVPTAFYALPSDHPSIIVHTSLASALRRDEDTCMVDEGALDDMTAQAEDLGLYDQDTDD